MRLGATAAAIFGVTGVVVLVILGAWQLQRLAWKQGVIASLEQRLAMAPVNLPATPDPEADDFLRVTVSGQTDGRELHVLTSQKPYGPGFRVIAPLSITDGRVLLVDLGFVPEADKDPAARPATGAEVVGALYWPNETDSFTPPPDLVKNFWFARDLQVMAGELGAQPLLVIAESHNLGTWPKPLRLGVNLPNDHLQYAITWFSLALIWGVMSLMLVRRERHRQ